MKEDYTFTEAATKNTVWCFTSLTMMILTIWLVSAYDVCKNVNRCNNSVEHMYMYIYRAYYFHFQIRIILQNLIMCTCVRMCLCVPLRRCLTLNKIWIAQEEIIFLHSRIILLEEWQLIMCVYEKINLSGMINRYHED